MRILNISNKDTQPKQNIVQINNALLLSSHLSDTNISMVSHKSANNINIISLSLVFI